MLFVITGNGKGKTTSALGMVERNIGSGGHCLVIQFIKTNPQSYGEYKSLTSQGVEWMSFGEGFTWNLNDMTETARLCNEGFNLFCEKALSKKYTMIVLDEFTYAINFKLIDEDSFIKFIRDNSEIEGFPHVVVTGRDASEKLIDIADTVSEVMEVKHHFNTKTDKCIKGIEF